MEYRIDNQGLMDRLSAWNGFLKKDIHLIACGGTALTLLGIKASTKDIDLIVPDLNEYAYLVGILKQLGYKSASGSGWSREDGFIFDLFRGKFVHTTELLESPLDKDKHILIKKFDKVYLGVLNYYDIIITKLRATSVYIEDCLMLLRSKKSGIDVKYLEKRFKETASFDVSEDRVNKNLEHFLKIVKEER
ncbi:MAG: hypothetical protein Q7O04_00010 [Candidatus Omnitrophota bacterium]|nr:hypothetical protein [Candidatus Omnitrophota bacterium]